MTVRSDIMGLQITSRAALNDYGSLEPAVQMMRRHRRLDLHAPRWRQANPNGSFTQWQAAARQCLRDGLHYDPGAPDLQPRLLQRIERPGYVLEKLTLRTAPWFEVEGFFLLPRGASQQSPAPAIVLMHEWGGPMIFGKERVIDSGRDHPLLAEHRRTYHSGRYLADVFVEAGYAVITIDAFHFGSRVPCGFNGLPAKIEPMELTMMDWLGIEPRVREQLYLGVRQLMFSGTTWAGVNYGDDRACVDYLLSRPEVDGRRLGCTGLSGGGWRTNMLAALDDRVAAAVPVGWMTTGDYQQMYNLAGAIGTFCLLPGVWDRLDVPDLTAMSAPRAVMVVSTSEDPLFPPEAQREADRQAQAAYQWAGAAQRYAFCHPPKPHCYDADIQRQALAWLDRWLKS